MNRKSYPILTVLLFLIFSCLPVMNASYADTAEKPRQRVIQVSGQGKVSVKPDKADITLAIDVQAKSAELARKQAASTMDALIKAVKNEGIASEDIQTRSVSLYPTYSPDTANKIIGYQLTNQVSVTVRDLSKASAVIDSAVGAGGNATRVQGIGFSISNPDTAMVEARSKAFASAKQKAEQYAKLAGSKLGDVIQISEGSQSLPTPIHYGEMRMMKAAAAGNAETPVEAGEQEVSVQVEIAFAIE